MPIESVVDDEYAQSIRACQSSRDAYIEYQIREAQRALPFLAQFGCTPGTQVLEVGGGRGGKGIAYACAGMQVVSLDVDLQALQLAGQAARTRGVSVRLLQANGTRLPFPNNYFDVALLDSVIEHVEEPGKLLEECARVLKPGGFVFAVFPPYYGPLSGHVDDYVMIPWFHLLPRWLIERYLLSRPVRYAILSPRDSYEVYLTLNRLTVFDFKRMARRAGLRFDYLRVRPFLTHPGTRLVVGLLGVIRHPGRWQNLRAVLGRARREFDLGTGMLFVLLSALAPLSFVPVLQEIAAGGCKAVLRKA